MTQNKRQQLFETVQQLDWWAHAHKSSGYRRTHYNISMQMSKQMLTSEFPYTREDLKAWALGHTYRTGPKTNKFCTHWITPEKHQMIDEWFEGYDLGGNDDQA